MRMTHLFLLQDWLVQSATVSFYTPCAPNYTIQYQTIYRNNTILYHAIIHNSIQYNTIPYHNYTISYHNYTISYYTTWHNATQHLTSPHHFIQCMFHSTIAYVNNAQALCRILPFFFILLLDSAPEMQTQTQVYSRRPYGVGLLIAGYDVSSVILLNWVYLLKTMCVSDFVSK